MYRPTTCHCGVESSRSGRINGLRRSGPNVRADLHIIASVAVERRSGRVAATGAPRRLSQDPAAPIRRRRDCSLETAVNIAPGRPPWMRFDAGRERESRLTTGADACSPPPLPSLCSTTSRISQQCRVLDSGVHGLRSIIRRLSSVTVSVDPVVFIFGFWQVSSDDQLSLLAPGEDGVE